MEDVKGCKIDEEIIKDDEFESTKLEMTGVREENTRLKTMLQQIEKEYKTLQKQFIPRFRQESKKNGSLGSNIDDDDDDDQEQELVSLRLGTNNIPTPTEKENIDHVKSSSINVSSKVACDEKDDVIELGLGYNGAVSLGKNPGPDNKQNQKWTPSKVLKTQRGGDEEVCQTSAKRARVCVRARCDTPTMNDGCQWRKYGQKIAKGNPCPRAYYRCTASPSCPVRKQVQRCVGDRSILITTYEGTHNHPLPISATAMASTTSAAASMLLSGSSASPPLNLHGPPAFHPSDYKHLSFLPNCSATTPFSTVTLDLTTNPAAAAHGGFSLYSSSSQQNPGVPTTSLSFSSMDSNMVNPSVWGSGGFSYNNFQNSNMLHGKTAQEQKYLSPYLEKFNQASSQQALTETLTKVITSDPSFRSVIAAVVSTMAANGGAGKVNNEMIDGENLGTNLKWGDRQIPTADSNSLSSK